jgi:hypothetical protein
MLGVVTHACNTNAWEAKAGGSFEIKAGFGYIVRPCLKKEKG